MNRLRDANIHCRRAASKEGLTEGQAIDLLAFATGWRDFDWGSVIFTDETSISSDCESRGHVYREPGTRSDTRYIQWRERSGWFSVSCWGWTSRVGVGVWERIHGRFNSPQYVQIMENVMRSSVRIGIPKEILEPGGPVVIILTTGYEVRGFKPGRGRWIFSERKNPEYDFIRKGSKAVCPVS